MLFSGTTTLAQRFTPRLDGLTAVDILLTAEGERLPGTVQLEVLAWPSREKLRQSQLPAADLPQGDVWKVRPGQPEERWSTFGFEPLADSAGRDLLFVLSYPGSADRPGERLSALAHFPGAYAQPVLLVNGTESKGNLLFRISAAGTRGQAVSVALENLARSQPVLAGSLVFPAGLAVVCVALAAGVLWTIVSGPTQGSASTSRPHDSV